MKKTLQKATAIFALITILVFAVSGFVPAQGQGEGGAPATQSPECTPMATAPLETEAGPVQMPESSPPPTPGPNDEPAPALLPQGLDAGETPEPAYEPAASNPSQISLDRTEISNHVYLQGGLMSWLEPIQIIDYDPELMGAAEWTLTKTGGSASDLTVAPMVGCLEFRCLAMNGPGTDTYQLTCLAGGQSVSIPVTFTVIDDPALPSAVSPAQTVYSANAGQTVTISMPALLPAGSRFPETPEMHVYDMDGIATLTQEGEQLRLVFQTPGYFQRQAYVALKNVIILWDLTFVIADENGVTPLPTQTPAPTEAPAWQLFVDMFDDPIYASGVMCQAGWAGINYYRPELGAPIWTLTPVEGDAADIALDFSPECTDIAFIYAQTLRHAGTVAYELSAALGGETRTVPFTVTILGDEGIPTALAPDASVYYASVGQTVTVPKPAYIPAGSGFTWRTEYHLWGYNGTDYVENVESGSEELVFTAPGYYSGGMTVGCNNYEITHSLEFVIDDGLGNIPPYVPNVFSEFLVTSVTADDPPQGQIGIAGLTNPMPVLAGDAVWQLTHVSGDAADLVLQEIHKNAVYVLYQNIRHGGQAAYQLTCTVGGQTVTIPITLTVEGGETIPVDGILLSMDNIVAGVGQTVPAVTAQVMPDDAANKELAWVSGDPTIATVTQSGVITGVGQGSTLVTAYAMDGNGAEASVLVTVVAAGKGVTDIQLNARNPVISGSGKLEVNAALTPVNPADDTVRWKSSDTAVAQVSSAGVVAGVSPGSAVITATASSGVRADFAVTVEPVAVRRIKISKNSITLDKGEGYRLGVNVTPNNALPAQITWLSSDESVAAVDQDGLVTAVGKGDAVISATSDNGKTDTCRVKVYVKTEIIEAVKNILADITRLVLNLLQWTP